jgi:membrane protein YdbS with pleckstrin-like domain
MVRAPEARGSPYPYHMGCGLIVFVLITCFTLLITKIIYRHLVYTWACDACEAK